MKALWFVLGLLAVAGILFAVSDTGRLIIGMTRAEYFGPKAPPIYTRAKIDNIANLQERRKAFDAEVRKRFPLGTNASFLVSELTTQGFKRNTSAATKCRVYPSPGSQNDSRPYCPRWDSNWNPRNKLSYNWFRIPCDQFLIVSWSTDEKGRLTHIEGFYGTTCL